MGVQSTPYRNVVENMCVPRLGSSTPVEQHLHYVSWSTRTPAKSRWGHRVVPHPLSPKRPGPWWPVNFSRGELTERGHASWACQECRRRSETGWSLRGRWSSEGESCPRHLPPAAVGSSGLLRHKTRSSLNKESSNTKTKQKQDGQA